MPSKPHRWSLFALLAAGAAVLPPLAASPSRAESVADFYRGKTLTITWGGQEGGSNDVFTRLVAKHIVKHIPGNPTSIVRYMAGAGGLRYANYVANVEPPDGTFIGILAKDPILYGIMFSTGSEVKFDAAQLSWIGSMARDQSVLSIWRDKGATRIEDARSREFTTASTGIGSVNFQNVAMANNLIGTIFKPILGYQGAADAFLALERGEVDGYAGSWDAFYTHRPQWAEVPKVVYVLQFGPSRLPELPDVPVITEFAHTPDDQAATAFLTNIVGTGRPVLAPPHVPPERLTALRQAFIATMQDPAYVAEAHKAKLDTESFMSGEQVAAVITNMTTAPQRIKDRAGQLIKLP